MALADATIRQQAQKAFNKMAKEDAQGSMFASSARHFIVAIPLMPRDKPIPMSPAFKKGAKAEYAVRYLEQLGASATSENVSMVERHMGIEDRCKAAAAWKSRGSVADYLYLSPAWAGSDNNTRSQRSARPARNRSHTALLDCAIVDSTLAKLEKALSRKAPPKSDKRRRNIESTEAECAGAAASAVHETLAFLEENLKEGHDSEAAGSHDDDSLRVLRLRVDGFEAVRDSLASLQDAILSSNRQKRLHDAEAARQQRCTTPPKPTQLERRRYRKELFPAEMQIFPRRTVVVGPRPSSARVRAAAAQLGEGKTCRPIRLEPALARELAITMGMHLDREESSLKAIISSLLASLPVGLVTRPAAVREALQAPHVLRLVKALALYTFRTCVLDKLDDFGVVWPEPQGGPNATSARGSPRSQEALSPRSQGQSCQSRDASMKGQVRLPSTGASALRPSAPQAGNTDRGAPKASPLPLLSSADDGEQVLLERATAAYAKSKAILQGGNAKAVAEDLPILCLLARACVDALYTSFYPRTLAALSVALRAPIGPPSISPAEPALAEPAIEFERTRRRNQQLERMAMSNEFHLLRQEYDRLICEIVDPGSFLLRSHLLSPKRAASRKVAGHLGQTSMYVAARSPRGARQVQASAASATSAPQAPS